MAAELAVDIEDFAPRYDLSDDEINKASKDYLRTAEHSGERYLCIKIGPSSPLANVGRTLEARNFDSAFGNSVNQMREEYGPYDHSRFFFIVLDRKARRPAGVLSCITDSATGLKSLNDLAKIKGDELDVSSMQWQHGFLPRRTWDVGTLAVSPQYRGSMSGYEVSLLLYRALYMSAVANGIRHFVAIVDRGAKRGIDTLGIPFDHIADTKPFTYLGSNSSHAVIGAVAAFERAVVARYEQLSEKTGYTIESEEVASAVQRRILSLPLGRVATTILGTFMHPGHHDVHANGRTSLRRAAIDTQIARMTGRLASGRLGLDAQLHSSILA